MSFEIQCEKCDVWQHGICMGIVREEDCPEKYYCELCRPDLHPWIMSASLSCIPSKSYAHASLTFTSPQTPTRELTRRAAAKRKSKKSRHGL